MGTARRECLDHLLIAGHRHLGYVLKEFVEHYQEARPHQGLDQRTPSGQPAVTPLAVGRIVRQDRLGGLTTNTRQPPRDRNQGFLTAQGERGWLDHGRRSLNAFPAIEDRPLV